MADIFNAFAAGTRLGMERRARQMEEQRAAEEQNQLAKINQLTSQAYSANDPTQRNALAQQVTALGGAQAGQNVMAIGAQQGEANTLAKNQRMEQIVRRVASVAQVPAGPEREAAWAAGVREVLGNDPQAEQLVQLGADQGINAVASQIAPVADVLAKIGYSPAAGSDGGPRVLSPGAVLVDQMGNPLYRNPAIDRFATFEGQDAEGRPVPYLLGTTGAAAGTVRDPRMGGMPTGPQPAPRAATPPTSTAQFTTPDGRPISINFADFAALDPSSREAMLSQLEQETGVVIPPQQRAQLAGAQAQPASASAPMVFGESNAQRAEAAALEARREAEEKGIAEQGLAYIERVQSGAGAASTENSRLNELERQLERTGYTGPAAGVMLDVRRYGSILGIGDVGEIAAGEAARALSNQLALGLRNPAGGEGMPGAMSDADRNFLLQSVPRLETTPDGWRTMIRYRRRINDRKIEEARELRRLRSEGVTPSEIPARLQQWAEENPIFTAADAETAATREASGFTIQGRRYSQGDTVQIGGRNYRIVGGDPADPELEEVP